MRRVIYSLTVVISLIIATGYYLVGTPGGLGILITLVNRYSGIQISAEVTSGSLYDGFELSGLQIQQDLNGITISNIAVDWHLPDLLFNKIEIQSLSLNDVIIVIDSSESSEEQDSTQLTVPNFSINRFSITNISVLNTDRSEIFQLDQLQTNFNTNNNLLQVNDLIVTKQRVSTVSNGTVEIQYPYEISTVSDISYIHTDDTEINGRISIVGDLLELATGIEFQNGTANITITDIETTPNWTANVSLLQFRPDLIINTLPFMEVSLELVVSGSGSEAIGSSSINIDYPEITDEIPIEDINLEFDTELDTDNSVISINDLSVSSGDISVNSSGFYNIQNNRFSMTLDWQEFSIFVEKIEDNITLFGSVSLEGTMDSYAIDTVVNLAGNSRVPAVSMNATGDGNLNGLAFESVTFELLDGTLSGELAVSWGDVKQLDFSLDGEGINPGIIWPEWDGDLSLSGAVSLSNTNDNWNWSTDSLDVSGLLKGSPLTLAISGNSAGAGDINMTANANYANLDLAFNGQIGDDLNVNWMVNSPDLSLIDDTFAGQLNSSGRVSGTAQNPVIDAEIFANDVNSPWGSTRIISATISSGITTDTDINANIMLEDVLLGEQELAIMEVTVAGQKESHQYSISAVLPDLDISMEGRGSYKEPGWTTQIDLLNANHAKYDSWSLDESVELSVSPIEIESGQMCLRYSQGSICMQGRYQFDSANWGIDVESRQISLALLQSSLPDSAEIDGLGDLTLRATGQDMRPISGNIRFNITDGSMTLTDDENFRSIPLKGSFMDVRLDAGTLKGLAELPAINENFTPVNVSVEISGYDDLRTLPVDRPLTGELRASGDDLSLLTLFSPELESLYGSFDIDLRFSGTMLEPKIQGKAEIIDASYDSLDLGIGITNINLSGTDTAENEYELNGQLQSGDGIIQAQAKIQRFTNAGIEVGAQLTGENFELVNLPELWAIVNPSINSRLTVTDQYYEGEITVPVAIIDLNEAAIAPTISSDEIVDGNQTRPARSDVNQHISINVILGDNVDIKGMGITGNLTGNIFLSNRNTNNILVAEGEININNGRYSAYGQQLTISEGRLIYNNVSLGNPIISISATRIVDGVTVGVSVRGYLLSPEVSLFSSANLPQEEILSYIIFGRPLNSLTSGEGQDLIGAATAMGISKSGRVTEKLASMFGFDQLALSGSTTENASVVVGKYINPRLYISYGLGIIDKISTTKLNYKLSNKFSLEAETSQESAFDVFYNLER